MNCIKCDKEIEFDAVMQMCDDCIDKYIKELDEISKKAAKIIKEDKEIADTKLLDLYSKEVLIKYIIRKNIIDFIELDNLNHQLEQRNLLNNED